MSVKKIRFLWASVAVVGGLAAFQPAESSVVFTFTGGASVASTANIVQSFNSTNVTGLTGSNYIIHAAGSDNSGAAPNSSGTSYLAVLAGGAATYTLATPTTAVQFDWGTASTDDTLTVYTTDGSYMFSIPNSSPAGGSGNFNFQKNGLATVNATSGAITGLKFAAASNSFEVDNVAAAVPEPTSWAMMISGFGLIGAALRRRRAMATTTA